MKFEREIIYDPEMREFAMYLDDEFVGYARSYQEAEVQLDIALRTKRTGRSLFATGDAMTSQSMLDPSDARQQLRQKYAEYRALGGKNWEARGWQIDHVPPERIDLVCALLDEAIHRLKYSTSA